jgi:hypothetical protein
MNRDKPIHALDEEANKVCCNFDLEKWLNMNPTTCGMFVTSHLFHETTIGEENSTLFGSLGVWPVQLWCVFEGACHVTVCEVCNRSSVVHVTRLTLECLKRLPNLLGATLDLVIIGI